MSKRFIETGIFSDPWFLELSKDGKLTWIYFITNCDHAGIFDVSIKLAEFQTGVNSMQTVIKELGNRIINLKNGKYFIKKFIEYQYPKGLSEDVKPQKSVIDKLTKYGLYKDGILTVSEQLDNNNISVHDKDKDKDKDKDHVQKIKFSENILLYQKEYETLLLKYGENKTKVMIDKLNNYKLTHGKKYKSDYGAINEWVVKWYDKEYINNNPTPLNQMTMTDEQRNCTEPTPEERTAAAARFAEKLGVDNGIL